MVQENVVEILSILLGVAAPALTYVTVQWVKQRKLNEDLKREFSSSSFKIDLSKLNQIGDIVQDIFNNTKCERFLLLSGVDYVGRIDKVSAVYEQHDINNKLKYSIGATNKYLEIKIDDNYRKMLDEVSTYGEYLFQVDKEENCLLKEIYQSEKVTESFLCFGGEKILDKEHRQLIYSSWATHEGTFEYAEILRIRAAAQKMQKLIE